MAERDVIERAREEGYAQGKADAERAFDRDRECWGSRATAEAADALARAERAEAAQDRAELVIVKLLKHGTNFEGFFAETAERAADVTAALEIAKENERRLYPNVVPFLGLPDAR